MYTRIGLIWICHECHNCILCINYSDCDLWWPMYILFSETPTCFVVFVLLMELNCIFWRPLQGGISDAKLEKAKMTQDDWIMLTNKANVNEKDMIKLLDWFIKVRWARGVDNKVHCKCLSNKPFLGIPIRRNHKTFV